MKLHAVLAGLLLSSCVATGSQGQAVEHRRVSAYIAQRMLDSNDYAPVEDQLTLGADLSMQTEGSVVGWELGLFHSADSSRAAGVDFDGQTTEISGGIYKSLGDGGVRPYLGAGLCLIRSEVEANGSSADDSSVGAYAHFGIAWPLSESFEHGFDARTLFGTDLQINGVETDADYVQLGLVMRFGF